MKYTVFGNCGICPGYDGMLEGNKNWGVNFDQKHKGNIKWYINYDQSNMQIATQVMLFSKPNCINIVGTNPLTRLPFIDTESPRSYDILNKEIGDSCFADTELTFNKEDQQWASSTWQYALSTQHLDKPKDYYRKFNSNKDQTSIQAYSTRNYLAQSKWELYLALALISKHGKAVGHDIRIIPRRYKDFDISKLNTLNKIHLKDINEHIDHDKIFWYTDEHSNKLGHWYWPKDRLDNIVDNYLQPWLDKDI